MYENGLDLYKNLKADKTTSNLDWAKKVVGCNLYASPFKQF